MVADYQPVWIASSPARGTWIEMSGSTRRQAGRIRRPPHGGRGLKFVPQPLGHVLAYRRPPHGGRGLKFNVVLATLDTALSSPARGTWIEILDKAGYNLGDHLVVPRTGDVD